MCRNKEMDVIGHKLLSVQEESFVLSNRYVKVFKSFSRITDQNLTAIFYRPYEMVVYVIYAPSVSLYQPNSIQGTLHPKWIEGMMDHGYAGVGYMDKKFLENVLGWTVTNPGLISDEI